MEHENDLIFFRYGAHQIRILIKGGAPWWVLTDVCKVLGIGDASSVAKQLDADERSTSNPGRPLIRDPIIINESGLYRIIFRSDKKEASCFIRWIIYEVTPQLRENRCAMNSLPVPKEELTFKQRIEIGTILAQCPLANLNALLDIFRPFFSQEVQEYYRCAPKIPISMPGGGYYMSNCPED